MKDARCVNILGRSLQRLHLTVTGKEGFRERDDLPAYRVKLRGKIDRVRSVVVTDKNTHDITFEAKRDMDRLVAGLKVVELAVIGQAGSDKPKVG